MTEAQVREQLAYYGIPAADLDDAVNHAMELIEFNEANGSQLDLAEFASEYRALEDI